MKILVLDDSKAHREAARLTLKGHDVTIVDSYDEAQEALTPRKNYDLERALQLKLLAEAGLPPNYKPNGRTDMSDEAKKCREACAKATEQATSYPDFDVVLTDLLMPPSLRAQGDKGMRFIGQEMPLGTTIALLALTVGIKNVAVATDADHHDHPASAAFDRFRSRNTPSGVKVLCTNHVNFILFDEETWEPVEHAFLDTDEGKAKYPQVEWNQYTGIANGKDWGLILQQLLG